MVFTAEGLLEVAIERVSLFWICNTTTEFCSDVTD